MASIQDHNISERLSRKFYENKWDCALPWGLLNCGLAALILLDICNGTFIQILTSISPMFWYFESGLMLLLLINSVYDFAVYFRIRWMAPLPVSKNQQVLLGIDPNRDRGFVDESPPSKINESTKSPPKFDVGNFFYSSLPRLSPSSSVSALWSSPSPSHSPFNLNETSMFSTTASSWDYIDASFKGNHSSLINTSPMKMEDFIADENALSRFLRERGAGEEILDTSSKDTSFGLNSSSGIWNQSSPHTPLSPIKMRYQLSTRSQKSSSSTSESDPLKVPNGELVWSKMGISVDQLIYWIGDLRKWLSKTIISPLVNEISTVNELLRWQGTPDLQIGESSLNALKLRTKGQNISSLSTLLQYLDFTPNQEYLVQRLKDLERGGCMSEFKWNGGGDYKGKSWGEHFPTDSAIVMHLFFTYLDTHSPLSHSFPEGRAVSSKHFVQTPDKLNVSSKDALYIYQSTINPPHYQMVVGEIVNELQKGRNNMFSAILLFLHHIKVKEDGMLKRVNLGPSGLNILWVMKD
ncbi:hypothetical protein CHUAL_004107 [Chamberlinius hualienensis]